MAGRKTRAIDAFRELEKWILEEKLHPGQAIVQKELAEKLNVSQTTIRTAIVELYQNGLAERRPGKGAFVPSLGPNDVMHRLEARIPLEQLAFKLVAEKATRADLDEIAEVMETTRKDIYDFDYLFHEKIWDKCHNPQVRIHLVQLVKPVFIGGSRFLNRSRTETIKEHKRLFHFLQTRNYEKLATAVREHIGKAWNPTASDRDPSVKRRAERPEEAVGAPVKVSVKPELARRTKPLPPSG